ncbi:MAG: GYD domain-containing protein [Proteobacteria bacterium]|nr:GYD domain-containing protein [Pseudomonadota bacterium]
MTIYITQGRFAAKGIEGVLNKPEDRSQAVAALMEAAGGKLLSYYVTMGEYDFLIISEGDSEQNVISALLTAAATGTVTDLRTVPAITAADAKSAYEKAQSMRASFRAAGGDD